MKRCSLPARLAAVPFFRPFPLVPVFVIRDSAARLPSAISSPRARPEMGSTDIFDFFAIATAAFLCQIMSTRPQCNMNGTYLDSSSGLPPFRLVDGFMGEGCATTFTRPFPEVAEGLTGVSDVREMTGCPQDWASPCTPVRMVVRLFLMNCDIVGPSLASMPGINKR